MSKFFVTNNKTWHDNIVNNIKESAFKISYDYIGNCIYATSTHKLLIDNCNYVTKGNDFVIQTGSGIYKKECGESALKNLYNDFNEDIDAIRNLSLGNYGNAIFKDGNCYFFCEGTGFYDIYYYNDSENWIVGTSLFDMAKVLKDLVCVNKTNILEKLTRFSILGNETIFNGINRLSGEQFITVKEDKFKVNPISLNIQKKDNADKAASDISNDMKNIAAIMCKCYGEPMLGCTGGYDSRMSLAAFLAAGEKPLIAYGLGDSMLAPSSPTDAKIDNMISERYHLKFRLAKWNETSPLDKIWDDCLNKYGDIIYDGCEDTFKFYTQKEEQLVTFGYLGELYREDSWSKDTASESMTIDRYLSGFYINSANGEIIKGNDELLQNVKKKCKCINEEHGIKSDSFKKEDLIWINLAYRQSADSVMLNRINLFKYSYYLMSEEKLVRNSKVGFETKYDGKFMLLILSKLFPDLLEIPIFSHYRMLKFNKDKMTARETLSARTRSFIMPHLKKGILSYALKMYKRLLGKDKETNRYLEEINELLNRDGNRQKIHMLLGEKVFNQLNPSQNHIMIIRSIILCKQLEKAGFEY